MNNIAQLLIFADSRTPMPDAEAVARGTVLSTDSIVGIPLKREALHRWAAENGIDLDGESVIEIERGVDPDFLIDATIQRLRQHDALHVLTLDGGLLDELSIGEALRDAGRRCGLVFHDISLPLLEAQGDGDGSAQGGDNPAPFVLDLSPR